MPITGCLSSVKFEPCLALLRTLMPAKQRQQKGSDVACVLKLNHSRSGRVGELDCMSVHACRTVQLTCMLC